VECGAGFAGAGDGIDGGGGNSFEGSALEALRYVEGVPVTAGARGAALNWNYLKVKEICLP
jgi:hypothetical protein